MNNVNEIKWIYFGVFINEASKFENIKALQENNIEIPEDWKMFNHHMTIAFNNCTHTANSLYSIYKDKLGERITLTIDGIGMSDDAIAVRVKYDGPIANKIPQITIATPKNGKPVNSNYITQWIDIKPYNISGTFEQFAK